MSIYRAMRDRRTGEIVGVPTPVHEDDFPYRDACKSTVLWRYMQGFKFFHMLETGTIWFSRVDTFMDTTEGEKPDSSTDSSGELEFFGANKMKGWGEQYEGATYEQKTNNFAVCWHMNQRENAKMWREYTPYCNDSVAIVGSVKSVQQGFQLKGQRSLAHSPVKYCDDHNPRPAWDYSSPFFYKDKGKYSFEREYRVLTPLQDSEIPFVVTDKDGEVPIASSRRLVNFNFRVGIHRIVFHPKASKKFKKTVNRAYKRAFPRVYKIEDSVFRNNF